MKLKELKTLLLENQCKERIVRAGINKALKIPGSKLINLKPTSGLNCKGLNL